MAQQDSKKKRIHLTRDSLIVAIGVLGLIHETLFVEQPRETLVWLFGGFILGVPFLRLGDKEGMSEKSSKKEPGEGEEPG